MAPEHHREMSTLEFHLLLALADRPLYGYAIKDAIAVESAGTLNPRAGSLYRVLARLMVSGLVREADAAGAAQPHPGLERKYYALTRSGRGALAAEARRLKRSVAMAERRLGVAPGRP
jgi:DNA-binding PadR family transcriptional regulator